MPDKIRIWLTTEPVPMRIPQCLEAAWDVIDEPARLGAWHDTVVAAGAASPCAPDPTRVPAPEPV